MEIEIKLNSCRVCLKNVGVIPFFNDEGDGIAAELISTLFNISVVCYPNLPDTLCVSCMDNLKIAAATKETIINSEDVLNSAMKLVIGPVKMECKEECDIEQNSNTNFLDPPQLSALYVDHVNSETLNDSSEDCIILSTPSESEFELDEEYLSCESPLPLPIIVDCSLSLFNIYDCWRESCDFKTHTYKRLLHHMGTHAEIKMYECEDCGKEFKNRAKHREHVAGHRPERPYECYYCNKKFKRKLNLRQHIFTHNTERIFKCQHCEKSFHNMKALQQHVYTHREKNVVCEICHKKFNQSGNLGRHQLKIHGIGVEQKPSTLTKKTFPASNDDKVPCEFCGKLLSIQNLKKHVKAVHYKEKPHKCAYCDKSFSSSASINSHMHYHINSKHVSLDAKTTDLYLKYKCDECDKGFSSKNCLKLHKVLHSGVKEHICPHCGKEFALKGYLTRHVRLLHNRADPRNFVCNVCGKISADMTGLKSHMLQHTGETPFHCEICESKFRYAKSLRIHVKNKHSVMFSPLKLVQRT